MVLHNPNNWHWVNKNAAGWTKQWLEENLAGVQAEDGGVSVKINKLSSMEGDVDVNQRKGKVITIFDVKLVLEYSGKTADGEEVSGNITVPEVAHDTEENEYVFDIDIFADANSKQPVKELIRKKLVPQLRILFSALGPALVSEHGKDIQHAPDAQPGANIKKPTYLEHQPKSGTSTPTTGATKKAATVNTTTVTDTEEFRAPASELYKTFTDPQRIAAFTRGQPKRFDGDVAKVGGKFEIFGGNVSGEYKELDEPKKIVQTWRLDQWPADHYSTLKIEFDQNDVDNVTVMRVEWTGVPIGQEEVTKRNWNEYYVRSIKTTFGFGTIL